MRRLKWFAVLAALLFVAGCGGSDSGGGGGGSTTPPGFVIEGGDIVTTATEACAGCHDGANNDVNVVDAHSGGGADVERDVEITDINITAGNEVTVTVNVQVAGTTTNVTDLSGYDLRFIFAELIAGTGGDGAYWENIFDPTDPTYERANTNPFGFDDSDAANGNYTYTFGDADGATVFTSLNAQTNTHRIGVQVSEGISNGVWDFVPTTGAITPDGDIASSTVTGTLANDIVRNDACNACHAEGGARTSTGGNTGIAMHGGSRVEVQYCITCHNPGLENSQIPDDYHFTGSVAENVDMKTMIHKLHMGKGLPSVKGGGSYAAGSGSRSHDYSTGGFPQNISNCEKCHDEGGTGAEDTAWRFNPSKEVCGTCHDRTTWEGAGEPSGGDLSGDGKSSFTLHAKGSYDLPNGFAVSSNSSCAGCHASGSGNSYDIDVTHLRQSDVATAVGASPIVFNIGSINLVGSAEGLPTVATLTVASGTATLTFDSAPLLPILPDTKITLAGSPNTNYNGEHTVLTVNGAGDQVTFSTTASSSLTDATVVYATRREDEVQIEFWVDDDGLYDGGEYQLTNTIGVAVSGITRTGTATKDDESGIYDTATITFAADVSGILSANDWIGVYNADSDSKRFNGTFEVISVATTLVTYEMRWSSTDTTPPTTAVVSTGKSFVVDTGPFGLGGASSLYMHIGWTGNGTDYTNPDASGGSTPGEPLTFSALQAYIGATKDVKEVNSLLAGGTG